MTTNVDWRFVAHGAAVTGVITAFAAAAYGPLAYMFAVAPQYLWIDAHVYFHATQVWIQGANPWQSTYLDIPFGAPPPALLLNLPLLPFGESAATLFWVAANSAGVVVLMRRLRLPIWWLLYQPILEGWLVGSPDVALAALTVCGGGAVAALVKPYAVPALIAGRQWQALVGAGLAGVASIVLLPWGVFVSSHDEVAAGFERVGRPISAIGEPVLIAIVIVALVSLGWRRGWMLMIPGLLALQPHYLLFALPVLSRSLVLGATTTFSFPHLAAEGVVLYAIAERAKAIFGRGVAARMRPSFASAMGPTTGSPGSTD